MSYYNPEYYNDEALNEENKDRVWFYDHAIEMVKAAKDNIAFERLTPTMDKILEEFKDAVVDEIIRFLELDRLELLVSLIDGQEE